MFCLLRDRCVFVFVSYMLTFSLLLLGAMGRSRPSVSLTLMDLGSLVPQGSTTQEALGTNTWSLLSRFGVSAQRLLAPMLTMRNECSENWIATFSENLDGACMCKRCDDSSVLLVVIWGSGFTPFRIWFVDLNWVIAQDFKLQFEFEYKEID